MFGQKVVDFSVSGDGLFLTSLWIEVDIVASAMPQEYTASLQQLADQLGAFHTTISLTWYFSGTSSMTMLR